MSGWSFTAWEFQLYCSHHDTTFEEPEINGGGTAQCPRCGRLLRARHIETHNNENIQQLRRSDSD